MPGSSNPADIYRALKLDVESADFHSTKIAEQKASFTGRAIQWERDGEISTSARDEIVYMVDKAPPTYWRPLVYIIPREAVNSRLKPVPMDKRAGFGIEWIIEDLKRSEFDVIEF